MASQLYDASPALSLLGVRDLDEAAWRRYVLAHPQGNVFHTPEMHQVFSTASDHRPQVWAVVNADGAIRALFTPVLVSVYSGVLRHLTTRSVAYGGVLHDDTDEGRRALRVLMAAYAAGPPAALLTELRNLHDLTTVRALLASCGFVHERHLNYLIDLDRPSEAVLGSISKRTRQAIRKGLRERRVTVEEVTAREGLTEWHDVLAGTYARAAVPLADRSLFEAAFDVLKPAGMIRFVLARLADDKAAAAPGPAVACSVELLFKDVIYGWYGGSDRAFSRHYPNELLMWHVLDWGARNGYATYDFGGAGKPDEEFGVRDFKAKFGGQLVDYGRFTAVHAPHRLRAGAAGYRLYRQLKTEGLSRLTGFRRSAGKPDDDPTPGRSAPRGARPQ